MMEIMVYLTIDRIESRGQTQKKLNLINILDYNQIIN